VWPRADDAPAAHVSTLIFAFGESSGLRIPAAGGQACLPAGREPWIWSFKKNKKFLDGGLARNPRLPAGRPACRSASGGEPWIRSFEKKVEKFLDGGLARNPRRRRAGLPAGPPLAENLGSGASKKIKNS
jgi:hypothetical protein